MMTCEVLRQGRWFMQIAMDNIYETAVNTHVGDSIVDDIIWLEQFYHGVQYPANLVRFNLKQFFDWFITQYR